MKSFFTLILLACLASLSYSSRAQSMQLLNVFTPQALVSSLVSIKRMFSVASNPLLFAAGVLTVSCVSLEALRFLIKTKVKQKALLLIPSHITTLQTDPNKTSMFTEIQFLGVRQGSLSTTRIIRNGVPALKAYLYYESDFIPNEALSYCAVQISKA